VIIGLYERSRRIDPMTTIVQREIETSTPRPAVKNKWTNYIKSLESTATANVYTYAVEKYMNFFGYKNIQEMLESGNIDEIEEQLVKFFLHVKTTKISPRTLRACYTGLKRFYSINRVKLDWEYIKEIRGKVTPKQAYDEPYTHDEIHKMIDFADKRSKVIVYLMSSTGCRVGSITDIKLGHLTPINYSGQDIYKVHITKNKGGNAYDTFCSFECRQAIDQYLDYRVRSGEPVDRNGNLNKDAPLIREDWNARRTGHKVIKPKTISRDGIEAILYRLIYAAGIRIRDGKRKINMATHALRKFYRTQLHLAGIDHLHAEILVGHKTSSDLISTYTKVPKEILLDEYVTKAMPYLMINEEQRLKAKVEEYKQKEDRIELLMKRIEEIERRDAEKQRQV
jgi:integrase